MGRLPKKGVDYFPHDTDASAKVTLFTLEFKYGNDGYAFWFKLLEFIGRKENLCLDTNEKIEWMYFVAKTRLTEERAKEILGDLAELGAIDPDLWTKGIVWSDNFVERLSDVYKKRGTETPKKPYSVSLPQDPPTEEKKDPPADGTPTDPPPQDPPKKGARKKKTDAEVDSEKIKYADFVRMKASEYDTLCQRYGKPAADKAIEILDLYKGSKGKTYKDDYRAILSWVIGKIEKEHPGLIRKDDGVPNGGNPFDAYM